METPQRAIREVPWANVLQRISNQMIAKLSGVIGRRGRYGGVCDRVSWRRVAVSAPHCHASRVTRPSQRHNSNCTRVTCYPAQTRKCAPELRALSCLPPHCTPSGRSTLLTACYHRVAPTPYAYSKFCTASCYFSTSDIILLQ